MIADLLRRAVIRTGRITGFVLYFAWDFVVSNLIVLREVLTPGRRATPAIIEVRLRSHTRFEIVSIANLLTLTPGTLAVEMIMNPPTVFMHGMFVDDPLEFRQHIWEMERRMLAAFRPVADWSETPEGVSR